MSGNGGDRRSDSSEDVDRPADGDDAGERAHDRQSDPTGDAGDPDGDDDASERVDGPQPDSSDDDVGDPPPRQQRSTAPDSSDDDVGDPSPRQQRSPADSRTARPNPAGSDSADDSNEPATRGSNRRAASSVGTDPAARAREHQEATDSGSPAPQPTSTDHVTIEDDGVVRWFLKTDHGTVVAVRDVLSSVALVALIGLILFGVSGIWPPMVAVESGSMEPNMERGDMIFVVDTDRFVGDGAVEGTGIVTHETGLENDHDKFGDHGDVIIFRPNGDPTETPVIHRAHYWVEEGDDWVDEQADASNLNGADCDELPQSCPAPHDGFVTKGDANHGYDQWRTGADTTVVKPEWTTGKAMFRIPLLGHVRLQFERIFGMAGPVGLETAPGVEVALEFVDEPLAGAPLVLDGSPSVTPALIGMAGAASIARGGRIA